MSPASMWLCSVPALVPTYVAINKTSSTGGAAPLKAEAAGVRGIFGLGIEYHHAQRITVLSGHQSATVVS